MTKPNPIGEGYHEPLFKEKVRRERSPYGDGQTPRPFLPANRPEQDKEEKKDVYHVACDLKEGREKKDDDEGQGNLGHPSFFRPERTMGLGRSIPPTPH